MLFQERYFDEAVARCIIVATPCMGLVISDAEIEQMIRSYRPSSQHAIGLPLFLSFTHCFTGDCLCKSGLMPMHVRAL